MRPTFNTDQVSSTPAFVLDEVALRENIARLVELREKSGCKVLYSLKALPLQTVIELAGATLDGVSVSSLFEAKLAHDFLGPHSHIHLTTPGLRSEEFAEVSGLCTHISFNSISQWQRLISLGEGFSAGLRINPKLSFLNDSRFDPCRPYSKLGIDIDELSDFDWSEQVQGLHLHTVFSCRDFTPLLKTVDKVIATLLRQGQKLAWMNLGGGYLFSQITDQTAFIQLIKQLKQQFACEVFIEPGNDIVGDAGYLVGSVVDCLDSDGKTIAILDTSVNHNPEVFEYQRAPQLHPPQQGMCPVILAGSSCLAGDVFGEYQLSKVPQIGDRFTFSKVGAYTLIKANRFNGYNLPDIYRWNGRQVRKIKQYDYNDYRQQWRVDPE
jgi:carboxynorspermidine decarboxylase